MKKLFFLLAMLAGIAASATVTVTPLSVNYNAKTVTFRVEYANAVNNRAWVWIDLCPVSGVTPSTFQTAVISAASATGNNVLYASTNTRGFFVTASPATVTATLSNASGKFNWCAYGSDYPPNAVINAAGGYTLKGTPPFTVNSMKLGDGVKTFGAGTCITSITDFTGNPDGIVPALPSLSSPNSPSRCGTGTVTLSATVGGGTTTAMTYIWNIGGTTYTNQSNSYTTASLSSSRTYSVKVKNANNCESNTASGSITINTVPNAPTNASSNSTCGSGTATFSATAPSSCTIDWYTASSGGSTVSSGTTSYTRSLSASTTYYAQSRNTTTGCVSASRLAVTGTVNTAPAAPTNASSNSTCGTGNVTFSATAPSSCTIDWYTASSGGSTVAAGTASYTRSLSSSATYYAQSRNTTTGCISASRLAVTATVNAVPNAPTGASSNSRCGSGNITFSATAPSNCTIDWYTTSSGNTTVATGTVSYTRSLSASTTYYAQSRHNTTGCVSTSRLAVTATVTNGSGRDVAPNTCGCATGLTSVGGYCRDLVADNAVVMTCSGTELEVRKTDEGTATWQNRDLCTAKGWRMIQNNEWACLCAHASVLNMTVQYFMPDNSYYTNTCIDYNYPYQSIIGNVEAGGCSSMQYGACSILFARGLYAETARNIRCVR